LRIDFVLGLLKIIAGFSSIIVVVDQFSKMTHHVPCFRILDAVDIAKLVFQGSGETALSSNYLLFMIEFQIHNAFFENFIKELELSISIPALVIHKWKVK